MMAMWGMPQQQQQGPTAPELRELLEPYSKEELAELITKTAAGDVRFGQTWMHLLHHDTKWCKLFVRELSYQTTNASLHDFYSQFGEVREAVVLMDKNRQSKGYGFVTFVNRDGALAATKVDQHTIDNRMTHCCFAFIGNPRQARPFIRDTMPATWTSSASSDTSDPGSPSPSTSPPRSPPRFSEDPSRSNRRLFVHSLAWKTDDETLRNTFAQYGEIEEAIVIRDKKSQRSKGYGFVVFTNAEAAQKALAEPEKAIDGRMTRCNLACERHGPVQNPSPPPIMPPQIPVVPMIVPWGFNGMPQSYMMGGIAGSSVSSGEQPFNPFGAASSNVSSGGQPVMVPYGYQPMAVAQMQVPNDAMQNPGGNQYRTKIVAVPSGDRSRKGNQQPGGVLPDIQGDADGSNQINDGQSDRSAITQ